MKKIIPFISMTLAMLIPLFGRCQKPFISVGAEVAFPAGNYQEVGNSGIGGFVRMEHPWSDYISGTLTIEYISYQNNEFFQNYNQQFSTLPIQFGIKYYTTGKKVYPAGFYLSGELGFTGEFYHVVINWDNGNHTDEHHDTYVGFCNTLGVGYQLGKVDAGFRFQTILSENSGITSYYNFRLAFTIR